ncbi:MAG: hypothetical protein WC979_01450 [Candidatus Pacearchaeota archaeon]|jgi:hypothetical protein|nr:hypothetical protein [Clostridia bacterium]
MKKISAVVEKVREDNQQFFILEKYNNDVKESMLKTLSVLTDEAKRVNMSVNEYVATLSQICK